MIDRDRAPRRRAPVMCASLFAAALMAGWAPAVARAQTTPPPPQPLTLEAAMQYAAEHYPALRASVDQVQAADAGVSVARTAYLPRLDAVWQSSRATTNNVFGQLLPQSVIPSLSGPVLPASAGSVWGSATGALLSWEPFDFGLRDATIAGAQAALTRARAAETLTRLDVQAAVAEAFLAVASAERVQAAAQADADRRVTLAGAVHALVDSQLRAGADASRADAERAAAGTRLVRAQEAAAIARARLARALGVSSRALVLDVASLAGPIPPAQPEAEPAARHPLALLRQAGVEEARAQALVLARTDKPRVFLQSSVSARGTGAAASGALDGGLSGLGLDRVNWAAGFQVQVPNLFDFSSLRARRTAAAATVLAEQARYDEALLTVGSEQEIAAAALAAARAIAGNTPLQLAAARAGEAQARARYDAGLAGIVDISEAQNLLAQAEAEDELARVDVWRALLGAAAARGDLTPFMAIVHESSRRR